jgi:hypothetical protein
MKRDLRWWERLFEYLGWHKPDGPGRWNTASSCGFEYHCARCGARLLMDSRGNWFAVYP